MTQLQLTKKQARQFILVHQGLLSPLELDGKEGVLQFIKRVGCIQYDPLNRVGRNPDLVLQSRIKNYTPKLLEELLYKERKLLDGWDKNMSIYSTEDWPYFSRYRTEAYQKYNKAFNEYDDILLTIRDEFHQKGPISSIDLKFDTKVDWAWAPTRISRAALESMFFWGELIVHHKIGTRKVYDFAEKHISRETFLMLDPNKTMDEFLDWMVIRRIAAIGLLWGRSGDAWLGTKWLKSKERLETISRLEEKEKIFSVKVENIEYPFYLRKEEEGLLHEVLNGINKKPKVSFIAPLDNLIWERRLIKEIFDFDYKWEVYTPTSQRKYGYYVLPVLYGDEFVARFEPILNKKTKELIIENWWWEAAISPTEQLKEELVTSLRQFMKYLGATTIKLENQAKKLKWLYEGIF